MIDTQPSLRLVDTQPSIRMDKIKPNTDQVKLGPEVDPPMHLNSVLGDSEEDPNTFRTHSEHIPSENVFTGVESVLQADVVPFDNDEDTNKSKKHLARLRRYEEVGLQGDIPVRDVVRFRYVYNRHIEGMSQKMQDEYNYWYFTKPHKMKDGNKYERHVKSWNRRKKWIADIQASRSSPNTSITNLSQERKNRRR